MFNIHHAETQVTTIAEREVQSFVRYTACRVDLDADSRHLASAQMDDVTCIVCLASLLKKAFKQIRQLQEFHRA